MPLPRSKTVPGFGSESLINDYPKGLVVRNTFLDFPVERVDVCELRQVRSAPCSPKARAADGAFTVLSLADSLQGIAVAQDSSSPQFPAVLELSSLLGEPLLGSPENPTVGSSGHAAGTCKPCAFAWKSEGCSNGVQCPYCHLCDAGEKKRRQKEKKAAIKAHQANVPAPQQMQPARVMPPRW